LFAGLQKMSIPLPEQVVIGRDTFFDFGPPFHYYEVIWVRPEPTGSRVDRILVTPPGDTCTQPATIELTTVVVRESIGELLQRTNPCTIPEKELHRERKRCKHCLVFSGANVTMQAQCGNEQRLIRMDVLDRDIYSPKSAGTPEHTSWTMQLLSRLDAALGPGVMEKPALSMVPAVPIALPQRTQALDRLAAGEFDALFESTQKVSELYRQAQQSPPPPPTIELVSSEPIRPVAYEVPKYPSIARAAHVGGNVRFTAHVTSTGNLADLKFVEGHPLLRKPVESAVSGWVYAKEAVGEEIRVTLSFRLNCASSKK
jgi:hypothetical protein